MAKVRKTKTAQPRVPFEKSKDTDDNEARWQKMKRLQKELNAALQEREKEVAGLLTALLAREHVLFLGVPGTAKTLAVELLSKAMGGVYYYWLMTKFSVPEELFGSFSLSGLKADRFERVTAGKLPEAEIAFLDEIFKANSSILNALLTLINERKFHNGATTQSCPLQTMVGASNELPEEKSLEALYDRFLLRYWVEPIKDRGGLKAMLSAPEITAPQTTITPKELAAMQREVEAVTIDDDMIDLILDVKAACEKAGYVVSDRRWRKALKIVKAAAWLDGSSEVEEEHLMVLAHVLWHDPNKRKELANVVATTANPVGAAVVEILDAATEAYRSLPTGEDIDDDKNSNVFHLIVETRKQFAKQIERLQALQNGKPRQSIDEAIAKIEAYEVKVARWAGKALGLSI